jgi:hypothetical protein
MVHSAKAILVTAFVALVLLPLDATAKKRNTDPYELIHDSIATVADLKVGDTRAKLERNFEPDGGISGWNETSEHSRYLFKKCYCIKIDVELALQNRSTPEKSSPEDTITSVSKPYLECPIAD